MFRKQAEPGSPRTTVRNSFKAFFDKDGRHVLQNAKELSGGLTNKSYLTRTLSTEYIARIPGAGTDAYISRQAESYNTQAAFEIGITPAVDYDEANGYKVTRFVQDALPMNHALLKQADYIKAVASVLHQLHTTSKPFANEINVFTRNDTMRSTLQSLPTMYNEIDARIQAIKTKLGQYKFNKAPCHNDTTPGNFLFANNKIVLIDFEYSGNNDPAWDLACLAMEADFEDWQDDILLNAYPTTDDTFRERFNLYKPVVEYWVGLWCLVQLNNANVISNSDELRQLEEKRMTKCQALLDANERRTTRMSLVN